MGYAEGVVNMKAMVFYGQGKKLQLEEVEKPNPQYKELLIQVEACGVCRTDLHIIDKELAFPKLPLILGHQIVGIVTQKGKGCTSSLQINDRVGIPWLGGCCGHCSYCLEGKENLCTQAVFTGYTKNGGFAEYTTASEAFSFPIPKEFSATHAAPLLCAGLIGFRSFRLLGNAENIGFFGFGSAAHILIQIALFLGKKVWAFTKKGDQKGQDFARSLGAIVAEDSDKAPPNTLDAAIIFAADGNLIPIALKAVKKGGSVVCAGIHMSDIPSFPYSLLYGERILRSVTNLTRLDGEHFFTLLKEIPLETSIHTYPLEKANEALLDLRNGVISGSSVLIPFTDA